MAGIGTELLYSQTWEDLECAREALRIRAGDVVLAIAGSGDNVLGLLLDDPARVLAVDINPAQLHLVELKRCALQRLSLHERIAFLGVVPDDSRVERYGDLRDGLSPAARAFWDARRAAIADGVIHAGRFERYLRQFRRFVLPVAPGSRAVARMLAARDVHEQSLVYDALWDSRRWRLLFRVFFSRRLLATFGRERSFFTHAAVDAVGQHFLERVRVGLTATPVRVNPYVTYMLTGSYRFPDAVPAYLAPGSSDLVADRSDRLVLVASPVTDLLAALPPRSVDAFYLSDVFELFSPAAYAAALGAITRVGRPGASLCYWNNLVPRCCPPDLAPELVGDSHLGERLHAADRAFIYSRFVVESVGQAGG